MNEVTNIFCFLGKNVPYVNWLNYFKTFSGFNLNNLYDVALKIPVFFFFIFKLSPKKIIYYSKDMWKTQQNIYEVLVVYFLTSSFI